LRIGSYSGGIVAATVARYDTAMKGCIFTPYRAGAAGST
jgi:hypothetical protein